jgi:hypothetical protein
MVEISIPVVSDLIELGTTIYAAEQQASGVRDTNRKNLQIAREQMAHQTASQKTAMKFNERMSSTAMQRGMKDMRKAGLNPILAYSKGGASSPSVGTTAGASAVMQNPKAAQIATALELGKYFQELAGIKKTNQQIDARTEEIRTATAREKVVTETKKLEQHKKRLEAAAYSTAADVAEDVKSFVKTPPKVKAKKVKKRMKEDKKYKKRIEQNRKTIQRLNRVDSLRGL